MDDQPEKKLPMLVCHRCGRYYSQESGEPKAEFVVEDKASRGNHSCKPCMTSRVEEETWGADA